MKNKSKVCIIIGLLLIAAALCLVIYNAFTQYNAGRTADDILAQLFDGSDESGELFDYLVNPYMDMPEKEINGYMYIGVLEIPTLNLTLPVMSQWDYNRLQIAPCRYTGSVYLNDMIICAHNYSTHFGQIKNLSIGNQVIFTDMAGNIFNYKVSDMSVLQPTAVEDMTSGDWDLTMFTCTIGGATRVTVRCQRTA